MKRVILILLAAFGIARADPLNYLDTVETATPSAYWRLDEASGNLTTVGGGSTCVASGSGLTYSQTGVMTDGSGNPAVTFNGSSGDCVTGNITIATPFFPDTGVGLKWDLEVWYRPASLAATTAIVSVSNATQYAWALYAASDGSVVFSVYGGGTSGIGCEDGEHATLTSTAHPLTVGVDTHIIVETTGKGPYACGLDTCVGISNIAIYLNGVLDSSGGTFNYTDLNHKMCETTMPLVIGNFVYHNNWANGTIDELIFYKEGTSAGLSPATVACHYVGGSAGHTCHPRQRAFQMQ